MTKIAFEREVQHSPEQMFDLVSDLAAYPSFVPNCSDMNITNLPQEGKCLARMHVSFGPINQSYESEVHADREALRVTAVSDDDPFSRLWSEWQFSQTPTGTHVDFSVDFEMRNRFIAAIAEPLFVEKQREIVDAFMTQAAQRYGKAR
ncbi:type II toxin-antitoxin system RatA family toxin [Maritalea porphyrae]|uniref:type II toxin-antitoxin system RatA family toxin n=1 Tax=Maritalea porphyrae TaxID=880732 RepID=UPI0022AF665F|nr:type II toxin-antitoxin system RatA family toxin [Maritalea porphyrae]MCZ4273076.1 type II toxin-antitoxin system RatA family toxin [Maritalea porphyrae]